jgi:hypothetical protein
MTNESRFTSESASEAGKASAAARRRRSEMTPEERVRDSISGKADRLVNELMAAALGEGDFTDLKLETRVTALTRLLEWQLGRPAASKPKEDPDSLALPASGDDLFES